MSAAGTPFYDVRVDFGARGDGSTDDTAAIQAAINAAMAARGGVVFFPPGRYMCSGQLNADSSIGIHLQGAGAETAGAAPPTWLSFVGTGATPFVSARSTANFHVSDMAVMYYNAGFTGPLIDLSRLSTGDDSAFALIENCVIGGSSGLLTAAALVSLDQALISTIRNCNFFGAQTAILGIGASGHFSNVIQVLGCQLTTTALEPILNPGDAWLIEGCRFTPRASGLAGAIRCGFAARALSVIGCRMADDTLNTASAWITFQGSGLQVTGNFIGGNASTTGIAFAGTGNAGVEVRANVFSGGAAAIDLGGGLSSVTIAGNVYQGVSTPIAGTITTSTLIQNDTGVGVGRQPAGALGVSGALALGSGPPTTGGNSQLLPNQGQPVSLRMAFGGDGTGWQYRIARNAPAGVGVPAGITDLITVQDNGNVGIGVTAPAFRLQLDIDSAAKPGTSTWSNPSDLRLKDPESITEFGDGLEVVRQLRPVRYRYNGRAGLPRDEQIGVVAQEASAAMPYAIERFSADDEEFLAFNPHALQYVLVNAIKELDARLARLKADA